MKTYLYPNGKTGTKSLNELTPEELEVAFTPKQLTKADICKHNRKIFWQQTKAVARIPYDLFLVALTALVFLPDAILNSWKDSK